jgi:hypothetical protein
MGVFGRREGRTAFEGGRGRGMLGAVGVVERLRRL